MTLPKKPQSVIDAQKALEEARKQRQTLAGSPAAMNGRTLADLTPAKFALRERTEWNTSFTPLVDTVSDTGAGLPVTSPKRAYDYQGVQIRGTDLTPGKHTDAQGREYEISTKEIRPPARGEQAAGTPLGMQYLVRLPTVVNYWELEDPDAELRDRLMAAEQERVAQINALDETIMAGAPEFKRRRSGDPNRRPGLNALGRSDTILAGAQTAGQKTILGGA